MWKLWTCRKFKEFLLHRLLKQAGISSAYNVRLRGYILLPAEIDWARLDGTLAYKYLYEPVWSLDGKEDALFDTQLPIKSFAKEKKDEVTIPRAKRTRPKDAVYCSDIGFVSSSTAK